MRFRVTALASLLTLIALIITGFVLVILERNALENHLDQGLRARASDIEAMFDGGESEIPGTSSEEFAQLVTADGRVVAATPNLSDEGPLTIATPQSGEIIVTASVPVVDDDTFRVLMRSSEDGSVLYVGTTYDVVDEATTALVVSLALLIPVLVGVLAALTWWLVGRTLSPVEDIRREVAAIGMRDLDRRVPEPGTGDEIDRLARTMNEMLDRLAGSMARESQFVSDASHELRIPLTRLRAAVELMIDSRGSDPETESIHEDILGMQAIVEDLLFLARTEAASTVPNPAPVDLDELVLDAARREPRIDIDVSGVGAIQVSGNRGMLRRAIANLIDNAIRHASSQVRVTVTTDETTAVVIVQDDGPGVPAGAADSIFDRFSTLDEARSTEGGTGLGLAIAREVVVSHGGTLRILNPGDPGARFEMRIPVASAVS